MKAERQHQEIQSRTIQPKREELGGTYIVDNRNTAQAKFANLIQRVGLFGEEEETAQGKFVTQLQDDEELQMKPIVQLQSEDEELLQGKFDTIQKRPNNTGLPDNLKSGVENMSGLSMDDVKVHYNSAKPAQMQAHAYAQGTDIHVAPGQEKHLAHEAWHVVQQKQGRVQPTMQLQGVNINNDTSLEQEADIVGEKAMQMNKKSSINIIQYQAYTSNIIQLNPFQSFFSYTPEQIEAMCLKEFKRWNSSQRIIAKDIMKNDRGHTVFHGGHYIISKRPPYKKWKKLPSAKKRGLSVVPPALPSSHYKKVTTQQYEKVTEQQYEIQLPNSWFGRNWGTVLFGLTSKDHTWFQVEGHSGVFDFWSPFRFVTDVLMHTIDFAKHKMTKKNIGSMGVSDLTETNPGH